MLTITLVLNAIRTINAERHLPRHEITETITETHFQTKPFASSIMNSLFYLSKLASMLAQHIPSPVHD